MGWRDIEYIAYEYQDERLEAVIQCVEKTHVNGGVILRCLRPTNIAEFEKANSKNLQGVDHQLRSFLEAKTVRLSLPELNIPYPLFELPTPLNYGSYEFEGGITQLLLQGGAYIRSSVTEDAARSLARAFIDAMIRDRRYASIYRIFGAWTDWFHNVAWDLTYIVKDVGGKQWWIFCVTDTD